MNSRLKKLISSFLVGCLVLSFTGLALACAEPAPGHYNDTQRPEHPDMTKHIQTQLDKLVADGTITKEQADKVFTFWKKKNHPDLIKDLMKHTDLSEGQAKAVADALRPPAPPVPPCDQRPQ